MKLRSFICEHSKKEGKDQESIQPSTTPDPLPRITLSPRIAMIINLMDIHYEHDLHYSVN